MMNILTFILGVSLALTSDGDSDLDLDLLFPQAPTATKEITLPEMLQLAQEQNFSIQKALASEEAQLASKEQHRAGFLPTASAGLAYNGELQLLPEDKRSHRFTGTAQIWLPLIDAASWVKFKVSDGKYALQQINTQKSRQDVSYQLAVAYLQALSMRTLLNLLRQEAGAISAQKQVASWRIRAGVGTASEELKAHLELVSLRQEYNSARLSYITQCETLGELLGLDGPVAPADNELVLPDELTAEAPEHLELTISRQTMELAEKSLKASKFNWLPTLSSTWQINAGWPIVPADANSLALGAAVNLSIPLFNWSTVAAIRESKANWQSSQIAFKETEQSLARQARLAKENMIQLQDNLRLYQEQVELATASLTLDMGDYQNGNGSVLKVVESRRTHQVAQVTELRQRYSLAIAKLQYWQAAGYQIEQIIKK